jgi:hypothetical protein
MITQMLKMTTHMSICFRDFIFGETKAPAGCSLVANGLTIETDRLVSI